MPLQLHPMTTEDALSWTRVRALANYGPTHDVIHSGRISESSMRGVAENYKHEFKKPNSWRWKVVDTDLEPSSDDPCDNGGRTIAVSVWSLHNTQAEKVGDGTNETTSLPVEKADDARSFVPPEVRLDALASLLGPLRASQASIMGTTTPYFMLNQLATHPDHQGRGAAKMMLDWGMRKADEAGLATYLNSTIIGKPIYERRGFEVVEVLEWDRVPWGGEGKDWHGFMVRPAKSVEK